MSAEPSIPIKAVFMGSDSIAVPFLEEWRISMSDTVRLDTVITQPDRPSGRGKHVTPNAIKTWASSRGIPVIQPENPSIDLPDLISINQWELAVVMAYGHILSKPLLGCFPKGCFNLHASLLPELRGPSPIETSIAIGSSCTGVTLMEMVSKLDAGPIIDQEHCPILPETDGPALRSALATSCIPLMQRNMNRLGNQSYPSYPQDESRASYCRLLTKRDAILDFTLPADAVLNHIRAFRSWPGSTFEFNGVPLKIGHATVFDDTGSEPSDAGPGTMISDPSSIRIHTADKWLSILSIQKPGSRMMPTPDFLRGFRLPASVNLPFEPSMPLVGSKPFRFTKK
ncbi:MAG: methionyl-tRNA formyltransferase [Opitutales bacterium]|nr:methionyl-tRNA formyltransferase [Opitutales bacterium]